MYEVWIDYQGGARTEEHVSTATEADALVAKWKALGPWKGAGWAKVDRRDGQEPKAA